MTTEDRKALFAKRPTRVWLEFVIISSENMGEPLYLVANNEAIDVGGVIYQPCALSVNNPDKGADTLNGSLRIAGVTLEYIEILQSLPTEEEVYITTFTAFADNPTSPIDGPNDFTLSNVNVTSSSGVIDASMTMDSPLDYYAGVKRYGARNCPAIYV